VAPADRFPLPSRPLRTALKGEQSYTQ